MLRDLKRALILDIEVLDDDPRDLKDVEYIQKVYYEDK